MFLSTRKKYFKNIIWYSGQLNVLVFLNIGILYKKMQTNQEILVNVKQNVEICAYCIKVKKLITY